MAKLFGNRMAGRVGPIWGFGDGLELRNMYCRRGQPGLWFIAGSLAQCRINSKYLGLQIKAVEEDLVSTGAAWARSSRCLDCWHEPSRGGASIWDQPPHC